MPPDSFLHQRADFKALVETVADSEKINDPALVEKDYWIMHTVFGLRQLRLTFELKGGTSLSRVPDSSRGGGTSQPSRNPCHQFAGRALTPSARCNACHNSETAGSSMPNSASIAAICLT
jgi:hypothetical protein